MSKGGGVSNLFLRMGSPLFYNLRFVIIGALNIVARLKAFDVLLGSP